MLELSREAGKKGTIAKLVYIVTVSMTADHLLRGQLRIMREQGFEVIVITSPSPELTNIAEREGVKIIELAMEREISFKHDLQALWQLYRQLRALQPDIVNASTPKAGLLDMVAAWFACVPIRIYVLRGLRLETTQGLQRLILATTERIAAVCAQRVVCVSHSLREIYTTLNIVKPAKLVVLGQGASNGVIIERFLPAAFLPGEVAKLRDKVGLPPTAKVIGFVGRFTRDKGIIELIEAIEKILAVVPNTYLLLVGRFEEGDPVPVQIRELIQSHPQIKAVGFVADTAPYYQLMDLLAFPSHREGFPNAPLEAAVAQVPTVGFAATGTVDAVQDGQTGLLAPIGAVEEFAQKMLQLLQDDEQRKKMGVAAQQWVIDNFAAPLVWANWAKFFQECVAHQAKTH